MLVGNKVKLRNKGTDTLSLFVVTVFGNVGCMRMARLKLSGRGAVYHCVSRVVGRQLLLDNNCKEVMVQLLWKLAAFYGFEVITYCMMDNHFHLLLRVQPPKVVADTLLLERLAAFYGPKGTLTILAREALAVRGQIDTDVRERIVSRMGDISVFMQEFKQRFSRWYNRRHARDGALWSERFRSVIIEDQPISVEAVAAYIDLNPVRAGIVDDPKDYRFCGYAAATAGDKLARKGLMSIQNGAYQEVAALLNPANQVPNAGETYTENAAVKSVKSTLSHNDTQSSHFAKEDSASTTPCSPNLSSPTPPTSLAPVPAIKTTPPQATKGCRGPRIKPWTLWSVCASEYRMHLFARAGATRQSGKTTLNPEKIRQVFQQGGQLSLGEICRLRLRHLTDGLALGTQDFINEVYSLHREKFSAKRQSGARPTEGLTAFGLNSLRNLRPRIRGC